MSYLLIGGDFVPTESNEVMMIECDFESLFGSELTGILKNAEKVVLNLESPLCDSSTPIRKHGPNLKSNPKTIRLLQEMNNCILSLANNHIMDQGVEGYRSTIQTLSDSKIPFWGIGDNSDNVSSCYIFTTKSNHRIGIYSCAEHEFSIAGDNAPGANPYDPISSFFKIKELSGNCDYTIVLYHGGIEHYRYPTPQLQKRCRSFADAGANLIVTQHSHCIGAEEDYKTSKIIYGQGNFLFDRSDSAYWKTGLLISLDLPSFNCHYYPIVKTNNTIRCATESESRKILDSYCCRSKQILQKGFLEEEMKKLSSQKIENYLLYLSGLKQSLIFRILNKVSCHQLHKILFKHLYREKTCLAIENFVFCESHLEVFQNGIRNYSNK